MAVIRRHPTLFGMLMLALGVVACGWLLWPQPQRAAAQVTYQPLDAVTAAHIQVLRDDAGLDNDTLGALNLTQPRLESLLAALRSWHDAHGAAWLAKWTALADQRAQIRLLESAIQGGQDQASALTAARQQLAQLQLEYETLVADLRSSALTGLDETGRALADRMRAQRTTPMPFRVLNLTGAQPADLALAGARYHQRLSITRDDEQRAQLYTDYQQALTQALGSPALQTLSALGGYLGAASERVVAAVQTVLPVSPES